MNQIKQTNSLDRDQDGHFEIVCKGYQQKTKVAASHERVNAS